jgi:hypothetical protein
VPPAQGTTPVRPAPQQAGVLPTLTPQQAGEQRGRDIFHGVPLQGKAAESPQGQWEQGYADRLQNAVQGVVDDPNIKPEDVIPRLQQIDPFTADSVSQLAGYRQDINKLGGRGQAGANYRSMLGQLAEKVRPNWKANNYEQQQKMSADGSKTQIALGRMGTMANAGQQVLTALGNLPPDARKGGLAALATAALHGGLIDPRYSALYQAWMKYNIEANTVATGGAGLEGETVLTAQGVPWYADPERFRQAVIQDADNALQRVHHYQFQWHSYDGDGNPPGYDPNDEKALSKLAHLPWTEKAGAGGMPSGVTVDIH